jgi:hypothetical protein
VLLVVSVHLILLACSTKGQVMFKSKRSSKDQSAVPAALTNGPSPNSGGHSFGSSNNIAALSPTEGSQNSLNKASNSSLNKAAEELYSMEALSHMEEKKVNELFESMLVRAEEHCLIRTLYEA